MVSSAISTNNRLSMGDSVPQPNAQDLRILLVGLSRFEQFPGGFEAQERDGVFSDGHYLLSDIKPKNVLASEDGLAIFVIDADVQLN